MEPTDITIEILKDIRAEMRETKDEIRSLKGETRDEIRGLKVELHETRDELSGRIDAMREELSRRIVDSEIRTSTAIVELAGTVHEMTEVLRASHDLRPRVERCEQDIADIRRRLP
jgi:chromosome segregation ATPase